MAFEVEADPVRVLLFPEGGADVAVVIFWSYPSDLHLAVFPGGDRDDLKGQGFSCYACDVEDEGIWLWAWGGGRPVCGVHASCP